MNSITIAKVSDASLIIDAATGGVSSIIESSEKSYYQVCEDWRTQCKIAENRLQPIFENAIAKSQMTSFIPNGKAIQIGNLSIIEGKMLLTHEIAIPLPKSVLEAIGIKSK